MTLSENKYARNVLQLIAFFAGKDSIDRDSSVRIGNIVF